MNILAVSTTGMGDSLLATPGLSLLRRSFGNAHITLLTHKRWKDLFAYNPHINQCFGYSNNGLMRLYLRMRLARYWDYIVVFHANGSEYLLLKKLNFGKLVNNQGVSDVSKNIYAIDVGFDMHAVDRRSAVARAIGANAVSPKRLELFLNDSQIPPIKPPWRILLQPAAANLFKMWPVENFAKLVGMLDNQYRAEFFVVGGPKDFKLYDAIAKSNPKAKVHNATGNSLMQSCKLIAGANLFITNDTGPMHISHALDRPTISLWCMTDSDKIGPYNREEYFKCIQVKPVGDIAKHKDDRTNDGMRQISVEQVFAESCKLLPR